MTYFSSVSNSTAYGGVDEEAIKVPSKTCLLKKICYNTK